MFIIPQIVASYLPNHEGQVLKKVDLFEVGCWCKAAMVAETSLDGVERLARALEVTVSELLRAPCARWEERVLLALLEQRSIG